MSESEPPNAEHMFPTLTEAQIERIAAHGRRRAIKRGDVIVEVGDQVERVLFAQLTAQRSAQMIHKARQVLRRNATALMRLG